MDMVALPFCHLEKTTKKPLPKAYPKKLVTIGDHIRKRRLDLKLTQKQVAELVGVDQTTVWNWERNRCKPTIARIPELTDFLGYVPIENGMTTLGEHLKTFRILSGMSQRALARVLGIDPSTLSKLESGKRTHCRMVLAKVERLLKDGFHIK